MGKRVHLPGVETLPGLVLDAMGEGVFAVDREYRITYLNRAAEEHIGIGREKALGRPCQEVFNASLCGKDCALRRAIECNEGVVKTGAQLLATSPEPIPVRISASILRDTEGIVQGGVETFHPIHCIETGRARRRTCCSFEGIIGQSPAMRQLFALIPNVARNDCNVLIQGPSGTGKELVARALHRCSDRRDRPLITVNCGALPDSLLESELFGYEPGAFTGANRRRAGRFMSADGGTLFLDEIGSISPAMQVRLLRFLQEHEFEPLGSDQTVRVDVRLIVATNEDLERRVREGSFREDLYYRIHVVKLDIPPLSARRTDIPLLVDHFIEQFNEAQGKSVVGVDSEVLGLLLNARFPGNVRQLENLIEYAFVFCQSGLIHSVHLPPDVAGDRPVREEQGALNLALMEQTLIRQALLKHKANRTRAAAELGIDPSTLYRKLKAMGMQDDFKSVREMG